MLYDASFWKDYREFWILVWSIFIVQIRVLGTPKKKIACVYNVVKVFKQGDHQAEVSPVSQWPVWVNQNLSQSQCPQLQENETEEKPISNSEGSFPKQGSNLSCNQSTDLFAFVQCFLVPSSKFFLSLDSTKSLPLQFP